MERRIVILTVSIAFLLPAHVSLAQELTIASDQKMTSLMAPVTRSSGNQDGSSSLTDTMRVGRYGFYNPNTTTLNEIGISFQADFPTIPEVKQFAAKTAEGTVRRRTYSLFHDDVKYSLTSIEYPAKFLESRKLDVTEPIKVLHRILDMSTAAKEGNKSIHRGRVQVILNGRLQFVHPPSMDMIISFPAGRDGKSKPYPAGVLYQRSYLDGYSVHTVKAEMSKTAYLQDSAASRVKLAAFLESFVKVEENLRFFMQTESKGRL